MLGAVATPCAEVAVHGHPPRGARPHARARADARTEPNELDHHEDGGTPIAEQVCERLDLRERARRDLACLKPHERRALALKAAGHSYQEIAELSRGARVNVAVLVRLDVGDMSLMEASRLPSSSAARPRARRARLLVLPRCDSAQSSCRTRACRPRRGDDRILRIVPLRA
jgi:hypothetical protein